MNKAVFFDSRGVQLNYIDWGGSGRSMVFLAGLGDTVHIFSDLAPNLLDQFRVVGFSRRGHGRSNKPDSNYDLDTFAGDILCFLDEMEIEKPILIGHSFGGIEATHFAKKYEHRVHSIIFLDALFPKIEPFPDLSGDPTYALIPMGAPTAQELSSKTTYLNFYKRARPAWAKIWCDAFEADLMNKVTINEDGSLKFYHSDELMNKIYQSVLDWNPEYEKIKAPMLAIVPDGDFHQDVPANAPEEIKIAADKYWKEKILPWIRQRTEIFQQAVPAAQIVKFPSPYHHIFIAHQEETVKVIKGFLNSLP